MLFRSKLLEIWLGWKDYKETVSRVREHLDEKIRVVRLEKIEAQQNLLLAYDGENNQFLGQGYTEEEIRQSIIKRFPQKIFLLHEKPFSALDLEPFGLKK